MPRLSPPCAWRCTPSRPAPRQPSRASPRSWRRAWSRWSTGEFQHFTRENPGKIMENHGRCGGNHCEFPGNWLKICRKSPHLLEHHGTCRANHHEIKGFDQENLEYNTGKIGLPVSNLWRFHVIYSKWIYGIRGVEPIFVWLRASENSGVGDPMWFISDCSSMYFLGFSRWHWPVVFQ